MANLRCAGVGRDGIHKAIGMAALLLSSAVACTQPLVGTREVLATEDRGQECVEFEELLAEIRRIVKTVPEDDAVLGELCRLFGAAGFDDDGRPEAWERFEKILSLLWLRESIYLHWPPSKHGTVRLGWTKPNQKRDSSWPDSVLFAVPRFVVVVGEWGVVNTGLEGVGDLADDALVLISIAKTKIALLNWPERKWYLADTAGD